MSNKLSSIAIEDVCPYCGHDNLTFKGLSFNGSGILQQELECPLCDLYYRQIYKIRLIRQEIFEQSVKITSETEEIYETTIPAENVDKEEE